MPRPITDQERLDRYVHKTDDCWLWTGGLTTAGYGMFTRNYQSVYAHRWSYELHVGPVPPGLTLDHLCRVRNCVRPDHLEPVTRRENVRRGLSGVLRSPPTVCRSGHDLTAPGALVKRKEGERIRDRCIECERERNRRRADSVRNGAVSLRPPVADEADR